MALSLSGANDPRHFAAAPFTRVIFGFCLDRFTPASCFSPRRRDPSFRFGVGAFALTVSNLEE
jgi:hypothetical protein